MCWKMSLFISSNAVTENVFLHYLFDVKIFNLFMFIQFHYFLDFIFVLFIVLLYFAYFMTLKML